MGELSFAFCPRCKKKASGENKVEELFGHRNNQGYVMVQSHCRECRLEQLAEKRLAKKLSRKK
jgi:hypothetical protein